MPSDAHDRVHTAPRDAPAPDSSSEKAGSFRHSEGSLDNKDKADFRTHVVTRSVSSETPLGAEAAAHAPAGPYRLYRRRFVGLLALVGPHARFSPRARAHAVARRSSSTSSRRCRTRGLARSRPTVRVPRVQPRRRR